VGESVAEALSGALAQDGYLVADRTGRDTVLRQLAIKRYARLTRASVIKAAVSLDAALVVSGRLEKSGDLLRVTASMLDVKRMTPAVEFSDMGTLDNLSALQNRLSWQMLKHLAPAGTPEMDAYLLRSHLVTTDALESYARGLVLPQPESRIAQFGKAARLDPNFTPPTFELGKLYFQRKQWVEASSWLGRVPANAPTASDALFHLGLARFQLNEFEAAEKAFDLVAQTVPLNEVFNNLAAAQSRRDRPEALANFQKALDGDPADPVYHFNVGYALLKQGKYAAAAERFRAALDRAPGDTEAIQLLGRCLKPPTTRQPVTAGAERLKTAYQEAAYLQLKALLKGAKQP
jgi:tetratricopeptide (TPR) repeat protein